jgi:hypothetical protein
MGPKESPYALTDPPHLNVRLSFLHSGNRAHVSVSPRLFWPQDTSGSTDSGVSDVRCSGPPPRSRSPLVKRSSVDSHQNRPGPRSHGSSGSSHACCLTSFLPLHQISRHHHHSKNPTLSNQDTKYTRFNCAGTSKARHQLSLI